MAEWNLVKSDGAGKKVLHGCQKGGSVHGHPEPNVSRLAYLGVSWFNRMTRYKVYVDEWSNTWARRG